MKFKYPLLMSALFLAAGAWAQTNVPVQEPVAGLEDSLKTWRHHIHSHPELSFKEYETSRYVAGRLQSFGGIEVSHPTETSVLGILKGGRPGPTIAFRADMDALPVQEETGFSFASKTPGVSHACGHDMHTAILLGTARVLASRRSELPGTVLFIFQHAEEKAPGGAVQIIESGVLKGVQAIFGLHVMAQLPVGDVGILPAGAASTASDGFTLTIQGVGSHGSMPQLGVDPIVTGAEIVMALQTVVSRNITPGDLAVITVGRFTAGDAPNVIPERAELGATIRSVTPETRSKIEERVRALVEAICTANGATYDLNYILSYPAIQNDPQLRQLVQRAATQVLGSSRVMEVDRMPASEDFSYYARVAPTCFFLLGVGEGPANHSPAFRADDAAMIDGVKTEVQIAMDYLNAPPTK